MSRDDQASVSALVQQKLDEADGEYVLYALHRKLPRRRVSFDRFAAEARAEMAKRKARTLERLATPPDPRLLPIRSWQYGMTASSIDEGMRDGTFLMLQSFEDDYVSSARWSACL